MTRLVGIRLNGIHSGIHRGHWFESSRVAPLSFHCPSAEWRPGLRGETTSRVLGGGQLRRPVHPAPPPLVRPAELCCQKGDLFCNSRKGGKYRKKGGVRGQIEEGGGGNREKKRVRGDFGGWGGWHLSVTHDGTAICPSGGGGEEERTLSHCEAGAEVWECSVLG